MLAYTLYGYGMIRHTNGMAGDRGPYPFGSQCKTVDYHRREI